MLIQLVWHFTDLHHIDYCKGPLETEEVEGLQIKLVPAPSSRTAQW